MEKIDLTQMKQGEGGMVIDIQGGYGLLRKLESLGIRVGVGVKKISSQFMGGPIIIQIGNTQAAIGFGMARKVVVEKQEHKGTR